MNSYLATIFPGPTTNPAAFGGADTVVVVTDTQPSAPAPQPENLLDPVHFRQLMLQLAAYNPTATSPPSALAAVATSSGTINPSVAPTTAVPSSSSDHAPRRASSSSSASTLPPTTTSANTVRGKAEVRRIAKIDKLIAASGSAPASATANQYSMSQLLEMQQMMLMQKLMESMTPTHSHRRGRHSRRRHRRRYSSDDSTSSSSSASSSTSSDSDDSDGSHRRRRKPAVKRDATDD